MTATKKALDVAVSSGLVAGVAAAITSATETAFQYCAGTTQAGGGQPITPDTLFWIASMTKPVTSVAAMQLVEQGRLQLDAPIGALLPALANPQILENGVLRPARNKITLRHLLTHTSGFTYWFANAGIAAYIAANNIPNSEIDMPLIFEPGTAWEYSISTDWVGRAVEAASGQTLDAYFREYITGPLDMKDTVFVLNDAQLARRTAIHRRGADGALAAIPPTPQQRPEFFSGGGGLYSTLQDYQKFLRMFLQGGTVGATRIISEESIAELSRNQIGTLRAGVIPTANPAMNVGTDAFPGMDSKWTLAFLLNPEPGPFGRAAGSLTWAGIANTYFWIDPVAGIAGVILMQSLPAGETGALKTYAGFEYGVYRKNRSGALC